MLEFKRIHYDGKIIAFLPYNLKQNYEEGI